MNRELGDPDGRVDYADLVLWRAAPLVTDVGHVLCHTMDNFFWSQKRRRLWPELADRGLHPQAVVSIDQALIPGWVAATSLVLFGGHPVDQLFVGRIERDTSIRALVENLVAHRAADDPHLGVLTTAHDFRGWGRFIVERNLARMFESSDMRAIADIGRVRRVQLRRGVPYEPPPNCLFVPTLGFGNVMTVPPDLEGKSGYTLVEVQVDPALARAEYVAGLLSSPAGKQLRESVATGSTIPNIKASGVSEIRVPLPALAVQAQAVQTAARLASMEAAFPGLTANFGDARSGRPASYLSLRSKRRILYDVGWRPCPTPSPLSYSGTWRSVTRRSGSADSFISMRSPRNSHAPSC